MKKILSMAVVTAGILVSVASAANVHIVSKSTNEINAEGGFNKSCFTWIIDKSDWKCKPTTKYFGVDNLTKALDKAELKGFNETAIVINEDICLANLKKGKDYLVLTKGEVECNLIKKGLER